MRILTTAAVLAGLSAPLLAAEPVITLTPPEALSWHSTPEGVAFAALHGARFEEAYLAMVRLPGGTISPPHIKSANMYGLMVQGQMTHVAAGDSAASAPTIGPGGYYQIPAGLAHISACVSAGPCITFLYQDGAFDFTPASQ